MAILQEKLKGNILLYFNLLFLSALLFILTFPYYEPDVYTGFDGAYAGVVNYLFNQDISLFKTIIHSYGPLGFLKTPRLIGNNYQIGLLVSSLLKFALIFALLHYGVKNGKSWITLFFILWFLFLAVTIYIDFYIYGLMAYGVFQYWESGKKYWGILVALVTAVCFFIKINLAIHSGLIFLSFLAIDIFYFKNRKRVLWFSGVFLLAFLIVWWLIYHSYSNLISYLTGWFLFSTGNTDFSALYPPNSLFLLGGSILIFLSIPFIDQKKKVFLLYGIFFFSFFATYKYSIARQENFHSQLLLTFMLFFASLYFILIEKIKPYTVGLFLLSVLFYYGNLRFNGTYHIDDRKQLIGFNYFIDEVVKQKSFVKRFTDLSQENLSANKLPESILQRIGQSKTDVTPWDLTYVLANELNYQPKPTLQSAALYYPSFIDEINARHIRESVDLKFILWEKQKRTGEMGGLDDKYLLNEDGAYLYELLNNYKIVDETDRIKLLERVSSNRLSNPVSLPETTATWNEWISVPSIDSGYIRAKLQMNKGFFRGLKAFFYKTGGKYIEYKLASGMVMKYRFSQNTESTRMWMNPYLTTLTNDLSGEKVTHIRFSYTDEHFPMREEIIIEWEKVELL